MWTEYGDNMGERWTIDEPNYLLNVVELCCVVSGGISSGHIELY